MCVDTADTATVPGACVGYERSQFVGREMSSHLDKPGFHTNQARRAGLPPRTWSCGLFERWQAELVVRELRNPKHILPTGEVAMQAILQSVDAQRQLEELWLVSVRGCLDLGLRDRRATCEQGKREDKGMHATALQKAMSGPWRLYPPLCQPTRMQSIR